jgi:hypothetical protein
MDKNTVSMGKMNLPVVGNYFAIFQWSDAAFDKIVDSAPFDKTNLLIIAFVHTYEEHGNYVADYENARGSVTNIHSGEDDLARIDRLVKTARAKNPDIKILLSLGWGEKSNDVGNAAKTPDVFAASVKALIERHSLDGFDIDYESVNVTPDKMLSLTKSLRNALTSDKIMTITPAEKTSLTSEILGYFDFVMPQTYGGNPNSDLAQDLKKLLHSYSKIVFGLSSEASNDPTVYARTAKDNKAAGIFAWRLDTDANFKIAEKMWSLMNPGPVKNITNQTNKTLEITLIIRKGDNPRDTWDKRISVSLSPGQSLDIPLPQDANPGKQPFLNGVELRAGGIFQQQCVENRGEAFDNLLNTNSKLIITDLPALYITGSNP